MNTSKIKGFFKGFVNLIKRIKTSFRERSIKLKKKKDYKKRLEGEEDKPNKLKLIALWILEALMMGIVINYALWQLLDFKISFGTVIAWAIVFYIITAEVPQFFTDCIRGVKK